MHEPWHRVCSSARDMRSIRSFLLALPLLSLASCGADPSDVVGAADDGTELDGSDDAKGDSASPALYYTVRPDLRRCVFPLCGGYWLKKLNSTADEIYVPEIDLARAGLDQGDLDLGGSVVRGSLSSRTYGGSFGTRKILSASAAWRAGAGTPSGTYYKLTDTGIVCFRAPCFSIAEDKLNWSTATTRLSGITGAQAGGASAALAADDEVLVAGANRYGAGGGRNVNVTAFFTRVKHASAPTCASVRCAAGTTCEMIQVVCITTPCDPVPTCVMTEEHLVELARTYGFSKNSDPSYTRRYFDTEAAAYAAATTTPSLLWVARDGAPTRFVWGYNDLWAERFEIDRITGDVRVTGEH